MNVVIHRYNSICEPDYIDAFKRLGLEVIEDKAEMTRKDIPADERIATIATLIMENRPMFVFTINFFPYIAKVCERLKCIYMCVSVDCPVVELFDEAIKSPYNRVFLFDYHQYEEVRLFNPDCIFHLPLGANVDRFNALLGEPTFESKIPAVSFVGSLYNEKDLFEQLYPKLNERARGYCDGLLSAQLLLPGQQLLEESIKPEIVEAFKDADKTLYDAPTSLINAARYTVVNDYLSRHLTVVDRISTISAIGTVARMDFYTRSDTSLLNVVACEGYNKGTASGSEPGIVVRGGVNSHTEMPFVFRNSAINLNTTMRAIQTGLPQRIWDVLGCGGFLLTNNQPEVAQFFEPGKHLETYDSIEEACDKIQYYLSHEDERLAIAKAGYEYVKNECTVVHRVLQMIKTCLGEG